MRSCDKEEWKLEEICVRERENGRKRGDIHTPSTRRDRGRRELGQKILKERGGDRGTHGCEKFESARVYEKGSWYLRKF